VAVHGHTLPDLVICGSKIPLNLGHGTLQPDCRLICHVLREKTDKGAVDGCVMLEFFLQVPAHANVVL
jgi:hypothetical protein